MKLFNVFLGLLVTLSLQVSAQAASNSTIDGRPVYSYTIQGAARCSMSCGGKRGSVILRSIDEDNKTGFAADDEVPFAIGFEVVLKNEKYEAYPLLKDHGQTVRDIYGQVRELDNSVKEKLAASLKTTVDNIDFTKTRIIRLVFLDQPIKLYDQDGNELE